MTTRAKFEYLLAALLLPGCVLPESGGGVIILGGGDTGGVNSSTSNNTVGGFATSQSKSTYVTGATGGTTASSGGAGGSCGGTTSSVGGNCNCDTGGSTGAGTCPYSIPVSGGCATFCSGSCVAESDTPPYGRIPLVQNSIFGTQNYPPKDHWVVALGAVTVTDADAGMIPPAASFQLGLYADNNGQPGDLLGSTGPVRAGPGSEGLLSAPVYIAADSAYWILLYNDNSNEILLEIENASVPEPSVMFADGADCLPSKSCTMPQLYVYNTHVYPQMGQFVPFVYARYAVAE